MDVWTLLSHSELDLANNRINDNNISNSKSYSNEICFFEPRPNYIINDPQLSHMHVWCLKDQKHSVTPGNITRYAHQIDI